MSSLRFFLLLFFTAPVWAVEGYVVGGGFEADSGDSLSGALLVDVGLTKKTWLSASLGTTKLDLPNGGNADTGSGSVGLDHHFDPVGVSLEFAYWGDDAILNSNDVLGAVYWRNRRLSISANAEYREFEFTIPSTDRFNGRRVNFDANGFGLSARFRLNDVVSFNASAINYDYSVRLNLESNEGILTLLSASRLSIINSLVEQRVGVGLTLDVGEQSWALDLKRFNGAVDGSETQSATVRFLTPIGQRMDMELGFGVDDSDRYGSATFFSVFLFFYG